MFSKSYEEKTIFTLDIYLSPGSYAGILKDKCSSVFTFSVMAARTFDKGWDWQIGVYTGCCRYIGSAKKSILRKNLWESCWTYLQVFIKMVFRNTSGHFLPEKSTHLFIPSITLCTAYHVKVCECRDLTMELGRFPCNSSLFVS